MHTHRESCKHRVCDQAHLRTSLERARPHELHGDLQVFTKADMFSARKKISKEKGADPDTFEESVAQVFNDADLGKSQVALTNET